METLVSGSFHGKIHRKARVLSMLAGAATLLSAALVGPQALAQENVTQAQEADHCAQAPALAAQVEGNQVMRFSLRSLLGTAVLSRESSGSVLARYSSDTQHLSLTLDMEEGVVRSVALLEPSGDQTPFILSRSDGESEERKFELVLNQEQAALMSRGELGVLANTGEGLQHAFAGRLVDAPGGKTRYLRIKNISDEELVMSPIVFSHRKEWRFTRTLEQGTPVSQVNGGAGFVDQLRRRPDVHQVVAGSGRIAPGQTLSLPIRVQGPFDHVGAFGEIDACPRGFFVGSHMDNAREGRGLGLTFSSSEEDGETRLSLGCFHEDGTLSDLFPVELSLVDELSGVLGSYCGDGNLDAGETCDDGNYESADGCSLMCQPELVGTALPDPQLDEFSTDKKEGAIEKDTKPQLPQRPRCPRGSYPLEDGTCVAGTIGSSCGNGIVEFGEQCDLGSRNGGLKCTHDCALRYLCGNGRVERFEECDDGNQEAGDGCSGLCMREN